MTNIISTDNPLSTQHQESLTIVADMMIPAAGDVPGAADATIMAAIVASLGDGQSQVATALSTFDDLCNERYQLAFKALDSEQRAQSIEAFKTSHTDLVQVIQYYVVSSYYQDDRVMRSLGLEARPPHPGGYEIAATDWSLLAPVRGREKIYRDID